MMVINITTLKNKALELGCEVKENVSMAEHTSFKAGGNADIMVMPQNTEELKKVLSLLADADAYAAFSGSKACLPCMRPAHGDIYAVLRALQPHIRERAVAGGAVVGRNGYGGVELIGKPFVTVVLQGIAVAMDEAVAIHRQNSMDSLHIGYDRRI